jgi:hypothetical protein
MVRSVPQDTTIREVAASDPPLPSHFVRGTCQMPEFLSALDGAEVVCNKTAFHTRNSVPLCDLHALAVDRLVAA